MQRPCLTLVQNEVPTVTDLTIATFSLRAPWPASGSIPRLYHRLVPCLPGVRYGVTGVSLARPSKPTMCGPLALSSGRSERLGSNDDDDERDEPAAALPRGVRPAVRANSVPYLLARALRSSLFRWIPIKLPNGFVCIGSSNIVSFGVGGRLLPTAICRCSLRPCCSPTPTRADGCTGLRVCPLMAT